MTVTTALDSVQLTTSFTGNQSAAISVGPGPTSLLVDYTKGSETQLEIQVEVSDVATPTANDWFDLVASDGASYNPVATANSTGRYRFSITFKANGTGTELVGGFVSGERRVRISARGESIVSGAGTVTVKLAHNTEYPVPRSEAS